MKTTILFILAGLLGIPLSLQAQPTNDLFASRTSVTGTNVTIQDDDTLATTEPGEPNVGPSWGASLWYEWTAPSNGVFYVANGTEVENLNLDANVYQGTTLASLVSPGRTVDGGIEVNEGDTLEIQVVAEQPGPLGVFTVTMSEMVPPPASTNALFADRVDMTIPYYHFDGDAYGASDEVGEPLPDPALTNTLWWRFVAPSDGLLSVQATSTLFSPVLTLYQGANFSSMVVVPTLGPPYSPQNTGNFPVAAGVEYSLQLAAGYTYSGGFSLDSQFSAQSIASTNDAFADAAPVTGTNLTYYGDFSAATSEAGEPASPAGNTVWVAWASPYTGHASYAIYSGANNGRPYVQGFTGPSLTQLQPLATNHTGFLAFAGDVCYFQFSGSGNTFFFALTETPFTTPPNDNFTNAMLVLGPGAGFGPSSVVGATMEPGEPAHMGATPEKSVWWTWQAPEYGQFSITSYGSLATNVLIAVYTGDSVAALTLVTKATNFVRFPVTSSQMYRVAAAVPTNTIGDVLLSGSLQADASVHLIPGNLLQEPSWEGTGIVDAVHWQMSGSIGGYVNQSNPNFDCDGDTFPILNGGASVWQTIPTVPGHTYKIQFGYSDGANGLVDVLWNSNHVGYAAIPPSGAGFWLWTNFLATASNTTTTVTFSCLASSVWVDDFSVVDETAAAAVMTQPASQSVETGGAALFSAQVTGTEPLTYQWFFQNSPLAGQTNVSLLVSDAVTNNAGGYYLIVSNYLGAATTAVATLSVDAPSYPTILLQPFGESVVEGGFFSVIVAALGTQPLCYQWTFNGVPVIGATNSSLTFAAVDATNAGAYQVVITNIAGSVWSLPATLTVTQSPQGGGTVFFANLDAAANLNAPVYDLDGVTKLNGVCEAQLYAGPSLPLLRAVGSPVTFGTGFSAGYFSNAVVALPNVPPGSNALVQVRAWDPTAGGTYEIARALGGRFGKSGIFNITAGGGSSAPAPLTGLQSFSLTAGLPEFNVGVIQFVNWQSDGSVVWSLTGEAGYTYLVEEAALDWVWIPYLILTNTTGTIQFTNSVNTNSRGALYRARILD